MLKIYVKSCRHTLVSPLNISLNAPASSKCFLTSQHSTHKLHIFYVLYFFKDGIHTINITFVKTIMLSFSGDRWRVVDSRLFYCECSCYFSEAEDKIAATSYTILQSYPVVKSYEKKLQQKLPHSRINRSMTQFQQIS